MTATEYALASYTSGRFPVIGIVCDGGKWFLTDHEDNRLSDKASKNIDWAMLGGARAVEAAKAELWRSHSIAV